MQAARPSVPGSGPPRPSAVSAGDVRGPPGSPSPMPGRSRTIRPAASPDPAPGRAERPSAGAVQELDDVEAGASEALRVRREAAGPNETTGHRREHLGRL